SGQGAPAPGPGMIPLAAVPGGTCAASRTTPPGRTAPLSVTGCLGYRPGHHKRRVPVAGAVRLPGTALGGTAPSPALPGLCPPPGVATRERPSRDPGPGAAVLPRRGAGRG